MKTGKFILALAAIATLFFTSCSDDDGYSLDKFWISVVTIENPSSDSYFFFDTDDGERMWTIATNLPYYRPKDGQRVVADYTILSDRPEGSGYDHDAKLNNVLYEILTKDIVDITSENTETLGNDPIQIEDIWIGGDHLNVEFVYGGLNKLHYINLGRDISGSYNDGKIHLEFRHNANGDSPSYRMWGMASFRLKPLQQNASGSVTLVIHTKEYNQPEEKTYELVYQFDRPSSDVRKITFGENIGDIK